MSTLGFSRLPAEVKVTKYAALTRNIKGMVTMEMATQRDEMKKAWRQFAAASGFTGIKEGATKTISVSEETEEAAYYEITDGSRTLKVDDTYGESQIKSPGYCAVKFAKFALNEIPHYES